MDCSKQRFRFIFVVLFGIISLISLFGMPGVLGAQSDCNAGGGIWCNNNECITPKNYLIPNYASYSDCTVSGTQTVNVGDSLLKKYYFNTFTITSGSSLQFYAGSVNSEYAISGHGTVGTTLALPGSLAGDAAEAFRGDHDGRGGDGGEGGAGGGVLKAGGYAYKGQEFSKCDNNRGDTHGGLGGKPGGNIAIFASSITLSPSSVLSAKGTDGAPGGDGDDNCGCDACNKHGEGAGGGGGGGGGGVISTYTQQLFFSDTAVIDVSGGDGGQAGSPGYDTGAGSDDGCSGGSGGGGAGGKIQLFVTVPLDQQNNGVPLNTLTIYHRIGGEGGAAADKRYCSDTPKMGGNGSNQTPTEGLRIEYLAETVCTDSLDNDNDNFADFADADCYNVAETLFGADNYLWANDPGPLPNLAQPGSNSGLAAPYDWWNPAATNGNDGVCGDDPIRDLQHDYGFISTVSGLHKYMCYLSSLPISDKAYEWLDADGSNIFGIANKYTIATLNANGKTVDTISNTRDWYYCDATGTNSGLLHGIRIPEGGTFTPVVAEDTYYCTDLFETYYADKYGSFTDCPASRPYDESCCQTVNGESATFELGATGSCGGLCYAAEEYTAGDNSPLEVPTITETEYDPFSDDAEISMDLCAFDASLCLSQPEFNPDITCRANAELPANNFNNYDLCTIPAETCVGGVLMETFDSDPATNTYCCFGNNSRCVESTIPASTSNCTLKNGYPYSVASGTCRGTPMPILGSSELSCCFGVVTINYNLLQQSKVSADSFSCFKQDGADILAQCCYDDDCANKDYNYYIDAGKVVSDNQLSEKLNRVQSLGGTQNTIMNFDKFRENDLIFNGGRKFTMSRGTSTYLRLGDGSSLYQDGSSYRPSFSGFNYLEFDVLFTHKGILISLNDQLLGELSDYSTSGDEVKRWHHVVIDLDEYSKTTGGVLYFKSLTFTNPSTASGNSNIVSIPAEVIVDNIALSTGSTSTAGSSADAYCTGGFEKWISDLDPGDTVDLGDWNSYGPYLMTCNSRLPYGWTGSGCCGDDTKLNNYGEFYNDSISGCFNGTVVKNGWAVWYARGIFESRFIGDDEVKDYPFKGLMYINNSFLGCQLPGNGLDGIYNTAKTSVEPGSSQFNNYYNTGLGSLSYYEGVADSQNLLNAPLLAEGVNNINTQCAVVGNYYCDNGAWRSRLNVESANPVPISNVVLKTVPGGNELIRQGFRGQP